MLLSIGMMVKNESKYLRRCLESLQPIRDAIESELIIVDTGSTDNTVEIAKEFTNKVYFHEWHNDFSEIRNAVIDYSSGEWFFVIDGDEILEKPKHIIDFFISGEYKKFNSACVLVKNFTTSEFDRDFSLLLSARLFKTDKDFHYEGAVHNQPKYKMPLLSIETQLAHYGYVSDDRELMERKFKRTSSILKEELEKSPENIYYLYQLSVSYGMHNDLEKGLEEIIKAYKIIKRDNLDEEKYKYVFIQLAQMYIVNYKYEKAEEICLEVLEEDSIYIDLYYYIATAQTFLCKNELAIKNYEIYLCKVKNYGAEQMSENISVIHNTLGKYESVYVNLSVLYLRIGNNEKAIEYINMIKNEKTLIENMDSIINIILDTKNIDALRAFYKNKIIGKYTDLEERFLNLLESQICKFNDKRKKDIYEIFSECPSDYALLNKLRLQQDEDKPDKTTLDKLLLLDFNKLPLFYGDVIYYMLTRKYSLDNLLDTINDNKLEEFIQYLSNIHTDLSEKIFKYLNVVDNPGDELNNVCHKKILEEKALKSNSLKEKHYKGLFHSYLRDGFEYIKKIYSSDIIESGQVKRLKSDEDCFLLILYLAEKNRKDRLQYVRSLRKALERCNCMKKGIELLLNETKEDLADKDDEMESYKKKVKEAIEELISSNKLKEASALIEQYENIIKNDAEIISFKAVIAIIENRLEEAENILKDGLYSSPDNFDLLYNLGYSYEQKGNFSEAVGYYKKSIDNCEDEKMKEDISSIIEKISSEHDVKPIKEKKKAAFFVKRGMDSFLEDIIKGLNDDYETKKIIVTDYKEIDEGMNWADICWFEWCDELIAYGSKYKLAEEKKIICRLHRYEAFTNYIQDVNWHNVDKVIFVAEHIRNIVISKIKLPIGKCEVIPNGINLDKFKYQNRKKGFKLACIGYLNLRKNPMIIIQYFNELVKKDNRYQLYFAGSFQEESLLYYIKDIINRLQIEKNVHFDGFIPNDKMSEWLKDKNYIVTGSIAEGHPVGVMEAMASGLKPAIHYFPGAESFYPKEYIYNDLYGFMRIITEDEYSSKDYREFIKDRYSLKKQIKSVKKLIGELKEKDSDRVNRIINYAKCMLKQNINFDCVKDLTLIIPTFNRCQILKSDLENGLKLGNQRKILVDDFSNNINRNILINLKNEKKYGIQNIIFHKENKGVAFAMKSAISETKTKNVMFCGDDDIIICNDKKLIYKDYETSDLNNNIMIPRYVLNFNEESHISIGYDRKLFDDLEYYLLLMHIFKTGEICTFNAGAIFNTDNVISSMPDEIFRVSEDYVLLSRILGSNLNKKIKVSESYTYIRRVANNTLSGRMDKTKLSLHLMSLIVSGYYCLRNKLFTSEEIKQYIKNRGQLLQNIYGYGNEFANLIINYISNKISLDEFINAMAFKGILNNLTIHDIPKEVIKIHELLGR